MRTRHSVRLFLVILQRIFYTLIDDFVEGHACFHIDLIYLIKSFRFHSYRSADR